LLIATVILSRAALLTRRSGRAADQRFCRAETWTLVAWTSRSLQGTGRGDAPPIPLLAPFMRGEHENSFVIPIH
jgi:hypothetical protein